MRLLLILALSAGAQALPVQTEQHNHSSPEKLGTVSFATSCRPEVQQDFNRGVALLHSFDYAVAENMFKRVAEQDAQCAMAHWGVAMSYFHELWEPAIAPNKFSAGQHEIVMAKQCKACSDRERKFIYALGLIYEDDDTAEYPTRARSYQKAMDEVAADNKKDAEAQVFYALALLANASPADKTHTNQKEAAEILEPLFRAYPQHPGIPHYLIHAYDNAEMASRGMTAAKEYSRIAAGAPHALHMPSHIFTRLGLWEEAIASNVAAKSAAHRQGDSGEELHSMDYLMHAYLQLGRAEEAAALVRQVDGMAGLNVADFKIAYAATAIPVRYAVERSQWAEAIKAVDPAGAPPQVMAIAVWARGLGMSRSGNAAEARAEAERLRQIASQLRESGNQYWGTQVGIMAREVLGWSAQAENNPSEATAMLRAAADEEDALEKLPVTPGPILPAREQLGRVLLEQGHAEQAAKEFATALANSPGRRGAMRGAAEANALAGRQ
jgi:tetratricopeptide (TPR) repeat protein